MSTIQDFQTERATWCPGCGDFGVLNAMQKAAVNLGLEPEQVVIVSGIGCSGKMSQHFGGYGLHSLHGRSLPTAQAVKLANRSLTVLAAGGDGDGYGIGMGHFIHAIRRNVDITYVVMDNHIYGLTTGQASPTSDVGSRTKTSPHGSVEEPIVPLQLALAQNCGFVAQGFSGNIKQLTSLIERAILHRGFSLVNVFSPCVTFNKVQTYEFYKRHLVNLDDDPDYNPNDRITALHRVAKAQNIVTGLIYEDPERASFDQTVYGYPDTPIAANNWVLSREDTAEILATFR
ncbi:2-oxoacid:ferredoxin oxidoreductase subunit beta [Alicyclobacillus cycloheptanicus]|uniref:2-oxoglutarate ferredoxin oxidoreductase subunit beta n=1 Tax=Alicyclobacillus cycloheptanicus TaxID=1457 RepID=A0ABT9XFD4_9BACL|nr:thiamine pyrophosphate-dependent enzyme [Alicyclobacillus cycloheptanicus]MDQ0189011.1 2-oxoglutarate ferredoxin oxidoreductase subunit beta [Alicyclobacillus cycloheptanicus]WDM01649.1 2-oxoacid:ferredoxin oxidoreductase subunit beta [Alicyclobacillus cycloheptanicus]